MSCKGGYLARIVRYDVKTREREVLIEKILSGGWHEPGGPVFSPHDGLMYFANGSVSQNGVCLPAGLIWLSIRMHMIFLVKILL